MNSKAIITSALPYANGEIHIGHVASTYLPADVTTRFDYPIEILINYGKSFFVSKDSINIIMSADNYEKLNSRILLAKQRGLINREDKNIEVNAELLVNNKLLLKSKVRLKGTYLDHAIGDKWSFRIKLKNKKYVFLAELEIWSLANHDEAVRDRTKKLYTNLIIKSY